ncbi:MAG: class I SAM-dependent methyltransferase [Bacteroidia bacterium]|nr:class I SAM-dependent methyltransferase [Bacteroidia bacterium]MCZ2277051.1 class I SAM-dependent methyltransferase [Bacteroidia bacterium]
MQYDPIKRTLGNTFNRSLFLRKLFYWLLDLLLLRSWHIRQELRLYAASGKPQKILDAGSGFGQYTYRMSRMFPASEILAVDLKEEQVNDCNHFFKQLNQSQVKFEVADLTAFQQNEKYDLVLCVDVMEHIVEDERVFSNLAQVMNKGAWLLISTPSDQGGSDVHSSDDASFIEEHVRDGYNKSDIENKLRKAGFSTVQIKYSYGTPGKISWRLSMKYPILMLGKSKAFFIILPVYYLITFPFSYLLNWLDVNLSHKTGTGLIVRAVI